jgi:penicillin-binding protein 1B
MTKRKSRARRRAVSHKKAQSLRRVLLAAVLLVLPVTLIYLFYLDQRVHREFEGKRWALPARVYARPLELYSGLELDRSELLAELKSLGYRPVGSPRTPGTFSWDGKTLQLVKRTFQFWDGEEPAQAVRVVFRGGIVTNLTSVNSGERVDLMRLDPLLIGKIYPAHHEDRVLIRLAEAPPLLVQGLLAVEDRYFYEHHGIYLWAIARALIANLRAGEIAQGGSTLTQQLVKNFFLSNERSLWRKFNEAVMALLLERRYTKEEIFEAYLNEVYLGQDGQHAIHGFGMAAWFYFRRPVDELNLAQIALLIALVKGPSYHDPRRHPEQAQARRDLVLEIMQGRGVITAQEALKAKQASLGVSRDQPSGASPYPAFLDLVYRQLQRDYREADLRSEGLQIHTTFDPRIQAGVEEGLARRIGLLEKHHGLAAGKLQGAVIVTSTGSGEVLAVAGGRQPGVTGFNRALDAVRQVGSLIKPAVYLTALQMPDQYTLSTLLDDRPLRVREGKQRTVWAPTNFDQRFHGWVPLHTALAHSYNIATARLGLSVGVDRVLVTLERLGVERSLPTYPSLFLGAVELAPLEVAQMYQTLAAGGFRMPLRAIREVLTAEGEPLKHYPLTVEQAFDPAPVFLLNAALQEAVREGTGRSLYWIVPSQLAVAGKTGTTDALRDSWFAGFTGDRLAVVWVGRDDDQPAGLSGSRGALQIWGDIIKRIGARPLRLEQPPQVDYVWIAERNGLRSERGCTGAVPLPFIAGSAPNGYDTCAELQGTEVMHNAFDRFKGL